MEFLEEPWVYIWVMVALLISGLFLNAWNDFFGYRKPKKEEAKEMKKAA